MKKLCVILTIALLVVGLPVSSSAAADSYRVASIESNPFYIYEGNAAIDPERTVPGDEIIIPIRTTAFKDAEGLDMVFDENDPTLGPTVRQLRVSQVTPFLQISYGKHVIRDVEIVDYTPTVGVRARSAIRIRFVERLMSTGEEQYRFTVRLRLKGTPQGWFETYEGMMRNNIFPIHQNDDYVDLYGGFVAEAMYSVDEIRVDLGENVSLYTNLVTGERYYGYAEHLENDGASIIMRTYPDIKRIYRLNTINLKTHGNVVEFGDYKDSPHYVYNLLGNYIGTTDDRLPYSTIYYLSEEQIEMDVDSSILAAELSNQYPVKDKTEAIRKFEEGLTQSLEEPADNDGARAIAEPSDDD